MLPSDITLSSKRAPQSGCRRFGAGACWLGALFGCWLVLAQPAAAATIDLYESGVLLHDPEGRLDALAAVRAAHTPGVQSAPLRPDGRIYWLVADIVGTNGDPRWVASFHIMWFGHYSLFVFDGERQIASLTSEDLLAGNGTPSLALDASLPFELPEGATRTVVVRTETTVFSRLLAEAMPAQEHGQVATLRQGIVILAFGAFLALVFYNLFLAMGLRDCNYVLYSLHALGYLLFFLGTFGYASNLFGITPPCWHYTLVMLWTQLFGAWFCYRFLRVPTQFPRLKWCYQAFFAAVFVLLTTGPVIDIVTWNLLVRSNHVVLTPLVLATAALGTARGVAQARYVLAGWSVLLLGSSVGTLALLDIVRMTPDTPVATFVTDLFEMFVLSLALADRVRQLQHDKTVAEKTNAAKSAFLATMSHEIRTPLYGVLGNARLLLSTPLSRQQHGYVATICNSGNTLLRLLNDILDITKAEADMLVIEQTGFGLRVLMSELIDLIAPQAAEKGLATACNIDERAPEQVLGDPVRLRQVLQNLLNNAVKFTEQGSVRLDVTWLGNKDSRHRIRFSVSDTGVGIPAAARDSLFDRFVQASPAINRRYGGTGLGLAICKRLVQAMGGEIGFESTPGRGSCFFVDVDLGEAPAVCNEAGTKAEVRPETTPSEQKLRVLVVDDAEINRAIAVELLRQRGHTAESADRGEKALEMLAYSPYDLVLMDLQMPGMDGLETTRHIRESGNTTPVIALTAGLGPEQRTECLAAGVDAVLDKSDDFSRFLQTVERVAADARRARTAN